MIKKILPILFISASVIACGGNAGHEHNGENTDTVATAEDGEKPGHYGAEITAEGAVAPTEFLAMMEGKDSLAVKVKGDITQCCTKKGCWMDLDLGNGETMKVRFKDYGFFVPLDSKGKVTVIEGMAYRKESPVDELKHYAEDAGKSQEEIDAITEPQVVLSFVATGVIIEG